MAANETNIFQPLFKQDEHANMLRQQIIDWAREQRKRLERVNVEELLKKLQVSGATGRFIKLAILGFIGKAEETRGETPEGALQTG